MPNPENQMNSIPFYGRLGWGNFFDWMVTFCLCGMFILSGFLMGSVHPETHLILLPCFALLLILHGVWYVVEKQTPVRLSLVSLLFLPFLGWVLINAYYISPTPWRGWQDLVYLAEAFVLLWVLTNNAKTMSHIWVVCFSAIIPVAYALLIGFYQFFQNPEKIVNAMSQVPVQLSPEFLGRATGIFADPQSFAMLLLLMLPCFIFLGIVPRFPALLRVFCLYSAVMLFLGLLISQVYWACLALALMLFLVPCFVFRKRAKGLIVGIVCGVTWLVVTGLVIFFNTTVRESAEEAFSVNGEGVRRVLWPEAWQLVLEQPIQGNGSGSFSMLVEQSPRVLLARQSQTPLNDVLHILVEYGLVGLILAVVPLGIIFFRAYQHWTKEAFYKYSARSRRQKVMPSKRFLISLGFLGSIGFLLGSVFNGAFLLPGVLFYGVLFFGILIKTGSNRSLFFPDHWLVRVGYLLSMLIIGFWLMDTSLPRVQSRASELYCSQRLEEVIEQRLFLSSNQELLFELIEQYANACNLDPENADLWIGRSIANNQRYFCNPALFYAIALESIDYAEKALAISPEYARAWSQLGVAYAMSGNKEFAEGAFLRALELAPHSSNTHYYWAAFASEFEDKIDLAKRSVERALEINPENKAALRLSRKLSIL